MVGFIFGGNSGTTYNDLQRRREIRDALAKKVLGGQPKNTAEGVGSILSGLAVGIGRNRDAKVENEGTSKASSFAESILSGSPLGGSPSTASQVSATSPNSASAMGSQPPSRPQAVDISGSKQEFVASLLPAAIEESKRTGVDPRIIVAQAAQETGWGRSAPGNNYFGIKSHGKGGGQNLSTEEVIDGKRIRINDSFRQFESPADSVRGYGDFITQNPRYKGMREAQGLDAQLEALQASGYATDPNYSRSVGAIARGIQIPQQVASLDPSAGMGQPQNAAQAIEAQAPQQMPPMQAPQMVGPAPAVAGQPMEVAGGGGRPSMFDQPQQAPQPSQTGGVDPRILQALANPFTPPEMKHSLQILAQQQQQQAQQQQEQQTWMQRQQYEQQQQQADPSYQADLDYKRAQTDRLKKGNRPITPEERQQWGIPQEDTRPYAMTPDGPELVGSGGQTINFRTEIDSRRQIATEMGIDPNSEEGKRYILTGNLPSGDKGVTAGDREAIRDSDDMVNSGEATLGLIDRAMDLSGKAYEGAGAGARALVASQWGDEGALATREYDNIITEQALGQLKSIFGGAPTEGERAILLDIQGSSSQPKSVRDAILQRARKAVERRVNYNRDRASELRGGTYYKPRDAASPANAAPTGQPQPAGRLRFNPQTGELE